MMVTAHQLPVVVRDIFCGLPPSRSVSITVAFLAPIALGVDFRTTVQVEL